MNLNSKHLAAILKIKHLRKELLEDEITEEACKKFEKQSKELKNDISKQAIYIMNNGFANHLISYSNPVEQGIDPVKIYGERGIYLVCEVESPDRKEFTFFTNKREAHSFANKAYEAWLNIYDNEE
jgi:hypothetical protein